MMGLWGMLPQFNYTKAIVVVDDDIDVRDWKDVAWALATRMDAGRDAVVVDNSPIDYLDFASPRSRLGGKLGLDATRKIGAETTREWGRTLVMSPEVRKRSRRHVATPGPGARGRRLRMTVRIVVE